MNDLTVVYDACVLYPAPLRDLLMHAGLVDLYRARWTDAIHDEWIRSVLKTRPELAEALRRTRDLMNAHVRECLVTDYERFVPALTLPDPDDRHVLAAAIRAGAAAIVTFNVRDFPQEALRPYGIEARHPDEFLASQFERSPELACLAARRQRASLRNPPKSVEEYLRTLESQGLPRSAAILREFADRI